MDPAVRKALKAELDTALREREKLDVVIAYLERRLGSSSDREHGEKDLETELISKLHRPASEAIGKGQFQGKSATKAARQVLAIVGPERPLKTQELFDALVKGGVRVKNANVLHRSLNRDDTFYRVERGVWSLSEWQPGSIAGTPLQPEGAGSGAAQQSGAAVSERGAAEAG